MKLLVSNDSGSEEADKVLIKRPRSSFFFWFRYFKRSELHKDDSDDTNVEDEDDILEKGRKLWYELPVWKKKFWFSLAQQDHHRYVEEHTQYLNLLKTRPARNRLVDSPYNQDELTYISLNEILDSADKLDVLVSPTPLIDNFLYIGDRMEAFDYDLLKSLGITHVLNCAGGSNSYQSPYDPQLSGVIRYCQISAKDLPNYPIVTRFPIAFRFISQCRQSGGKVIVHCVKGINRSAAVCVAYLMIDGSGRDLIQAATHMKSRRPLVLTNMSFRRQLVAFQRDLASWPVP